MDTYIVANILLLFHLLYETQDVMEYEHEQLVLCQDKGDDVAEFYPKTKVLKHLEQRLKDELCLLAA